MIYIHRDWNLIPQNIKDDLKAAAADLEDIDDKEKRKEYIHENRGKWAAVREYLSAMSHGKCWYSEAKEGVSRYQVDHFRPHGRAKQALKIYAEGYSWLAFDLENFRLAGMLCNTATQEYSEETVGKSDWFPLVDPDKRANLASRNVAIETPILLDPTDPEDPPKLIFIDDGTVKPDPDLREHVQNSIKVAIDYLGLRQSQLDGKRRTTWRECNKKIVKYNRIAKKPKGARTAEESETLIELAKELCAMSCAASEFAAVARCCLIANRLSQFIIRDELTALAVEG